MKVTIDVAERGQRERSEILQLFQLATLLVPARSSDGTATAREITDEVTKMFKKRMDGAQTHIAITRLIDRGLMVVAGDPEARPRRFSVTPAGSATIDATIAAMVAVIGFADNLGSQKDISDAPRPKSGRSDRTFPSRALRK